MSNSNKNSIKFHEFLKKIKKSPEYTIIKGQLQDLFNNLYQEDGQKNIEKIFQQKADDQGFDIKFKRLNSQQIQKNNFITQKSSFQTMFINWKANRQYYSESELLIFLESLHDNLSLMQSLKKRLCKLQINLVTTPLSELKKKIVLIKQEEIMIKDDFLTREDICYYLKQDYPIELRKKLYFLYFQKTQLKKASNIRNQECNKIYLQNSSNDSHFFIFQESIEQCLKTYFSTNSSQQLIHFYKYVGPFCFLTTDQDEINYLFKNFQDIFFHHLNQINSESTSILYLSCQFEDLLKQQEETLFYYLNQHGNYNISDIKPLDLVFPWLIYCFIGFLRIDQVFIVFDYILAFSTLELLPLLAVSILSHFSKFLIKEKNIYSSISKQDIINSIQLDQIDVNIHLQIILNKK